jgi:hypothetical protein
MAINSACLLKDVTAKARRREGSAKENKTILWRWIFDGFNFPLVVTAWFRFALRAVLCVFAPLRVTG